MELSRMLINDIRNRRILWDKQHKGYHDRMLVDNEWDEVAANTNLKKEGVKSRWKNLRDSFRKELKRIPYNFEIGTRDFSLYTGTWPYFDDMLFLSNIVKIKPHHFYPSVSPPSPVSPIVDIVVNESSTDNDEIENIRFSANDRLLANSLSTNKIICRKRKVNESPTELSPVTQESAQKLEDDEDFNFFKSMIPHVKLLPSVEKLHFRSRVQDILADHLSKLHKHRNNYSQENEHITRTDDYKFFEKYELK